MKKLTKKEKDNVRLVRAIWILLVYINISLIVLVYLVDLVLNQNILASVLNIISVVSKWFWGLLTLYIFLSKNITLADIFPYFFHIVENYKLAHKELKKRFRDRK